MTRREIREHVFTMLFACSFADDEQKMDQLALLCEDEDFPSDSEAAGIAREILSKTQELDAVIAQYSEKRAVSRISRVNLALLRLALYEIKYASRVPVSVAINEAVELCKKYADKSDCVFINGVLGAYARTLPTQDGQVSE